MADCQCRCRRGRRLPLHTLRARYLVSASASSTSPRHGASPACAVPVPFSIALPSRGVSDFAGALSEGLADA